MSARSILALVCGLLGGVALAAFIVFQFFDIEGLYKNINSLFGFERPEPVIGTVVSFKGVSREDRLLTATTRSVVIIYKYVNPEDFTGRFFSDPEEHKQGWKKLKESPEYSHRRDDRKYLDGLCIHVVEATLGFSDLGKIQTAIQNDESLLRQFCGQTQGEFSVPAETLLKQMEAVELEVVSAKSIPGEKRTWKSFESIKCDSYEQGAVQSRPIAKFLLEGLKADHVYWAKTHKNGLFLLGAYLRNFCSEKTVTKQGASL